MDGGGAGLRRCLTSCGCRLPTPLLVGEADLSASGPSASFSLTPVRLSTNPAYVGALEEMLCVMYVGIVVMDVIWP